MAASGNLLLELLSPQDAASLADISRVVALKENAVLQSAGSAMDVVLFPTSGMVSLSAALQDGSEVTVCSVDRGGAVHAAPCDRDAPSCLTARVTLRGEALQLPLRRWQEWVAQRPLARALFEAYGELLLSQVQQHFACHVRHDSESRLCHWLLLMQECLGEAPILMTHQALARLLGVRRTTVTLVAKTLQDAGIINYRRGAIEVVDGYALQQSSCECYAASSMRMLAFRRRALSLACRTADSGDPELRNGVAYSA
jgi:CRP-like cAMP-binding protein